MSFINDDTINEHLNDGCARLYKDLRRNSIPVPVTPLPKGLARITMAVRLWRYGFLSASAALTVAMGSCSSACTVTPQQHAANVGEAAQASAEYDACRQSAKDGGTFATFCECVRGVDAKHHVEGGPCE